MKFRIFGFLAAGILSVGIVQAQTSPWISREWSDPITDAKQYIAATFGHDGEHLIVLCSNGNVEVIARLNRFDIKITPTREIVYRIDKTEPVVDHWRNKSTGDFGIDGRKAALFANRAIDSSDIVIRSEGNTVIFSTENIKETFAPLIRNCPTLFDGK